jgi:hypothetical protein
MNYLDEITTEIEKALEPDYLIKRSGEFYSRHPRASTRGCDDQRLFGGELKRLGNEPTRSF